MVYRPATLACLAVLSFAAIAPAQPPADPLPLDGVLTPLVPLAIPPETSRLHFDFLIGLPTGARGQVRLNNDPATALVVEGFVGAEVILPTVGAGLRRRIPCWDCGRWSFAVSPGVDVYGIYALFAGGLAVIADVDVLWSRRLDNGGTFDIGLKAGAGPAAFDGFWGNSRVGVLPVASAIVAWHF